MVSLTEALAAERENLQRNSAENEARREVGRRSVGGKTGDTNVDEAAFMSALITLLHCPRNI